MYNSRSKQRLFVKKLNNNNFMNIKLYILPRKIGSFPIYNHRHHNHHH